MQRKIRNETPSFRAMCLVAAAGAAVAAAARTRTDTTIRPTTTRRAAMRRAAKDEGRKPAAAETARAGDRAQARPAPGGPSGRRKGSPRSNSAA
jgi:hypothetical protein